jgi:hypothetical protein
MHVFDIFFQRSLYGSALHAGVIMRNSTVVGCLLDLGADVNIRPSNSLYTPLEVASRYHFPEIVDLLLSRGAELFSPTAEGWPGWALHAAGTTTEPLLRYIRPIEQETVRVATLPIASRIRPQPPGGQTIGPRAESPTNRIGFA